MKEHWQKDGIGDVNSNTRGSGARYNTGKVAIELIPLRLIAEQFELVTAEDDPVNALIGALWNLALFQEGGDATYLRKTIELVGSAWDECAAVFDYGRRKYAEWNWAKGMAWSVPLACAARHLIFGMMKGEELDPESGLPHRGHLLCNIVMLLTFIRTYPEGDDLPSQWLRDAAMTEHAARETDARLIQQSNSEAA
ncbi:dATP/dGTP diphosphohydrolase domain-containing protein [Paraburkholderia tropica]|uniref:dATP/dGTP diphosphohydrolase domain-containing protein n=1 Tax=Paraburkholderia tropica TaxID=92647 RepID=UPI003D28B13B